MKQLEMTPELSALIKKAVGEDVDTAKLAVFETIALNNKPLPGKRGSIFENAVVAPLTLSQMVDFVNAGNPLPLMSDHVMFGAPAGKFFHAGLGYSEDGAVEMRSLFYLDETEVATIAKLNAGSIDEVSVQFLSTQFNCSECGWDYFEFGDSENIESRTCANGHTIGSDGVHANMVGLNQFIELSMVARGAADKPKIVGKSQSKLAPETTYRLAAKGFEPDALVVYASMGKEDVMDTTALLKDLVDSGVKVATLTADVSAKTGIITDLTGQLTAAEASVTSLTAELTAAKAATAVPADYETTKAEVTEAVAYLSAQFDHLTVASGKAKLEGDARPKTVAEFKTEIDKLTGGLTSILPVGGVARTANDTNEKTLNASFDASAFSVRK